jgi:HD-GYP domain-containing protein (c-di-GMP phosphodiesterase class II)
LNVSGHEAVRRVYASDSVQERNPTGGQWKSRPVVAVLLRLTISFLPLVIAAAVTLTIQALLLAPGLRGHGILLHVAAYAGLAAATVIVARVVERIARRALPLVALLRLSLLFPDQAPSRFQMARAAGNPAALARLAEQADEQGAAATQVLALLSRLSEHERRTRGHSERVRVYTDLLGEQLNLTAEDRLRLRLAALVHDVGKLTVPADLLLKPGRPTAEEWATLQGHPEAGIELAGPVAEWLGSWVGGINEHHERFDGTGYPRRLAGDDISLAGRIVAVADAFETMTANRPYKKQMTVSAARKELVDCAGSHFDPVVVRAFTDISLPQLRRRTLAAGIFLHVPVLGQAQFALGQVVGLAGPAGTGAMATLTASIPTSAAVVTVLATSVAVGIVPAAAATGPIAKASKPAAATAPSASTPTAGTVAPAHQAYATLGGAAPTSSAGTRVASSRVTKAGHPVSGLKTRSDFRRPQSPTASASTTPASTTSMATASSASDPSSASVATPPTASAPENAEAATPDSVNPKPPKPVDPAPKHEDPKPPKPPKPVGPAPKHAEPAPPAPPKPVGPASKHVNPPGKVKS